MYEKGSGIPKDQEKAYELYKKVEEQYPDIFSVFKRFNELTGKYVDAVSPWDDNAGIQIKDIDEFQFYLEKAETGDAEAQYKIGSMYEFGKGTRKNEEKSKYWYGKAAEQGHALSQTIVGKPILKSRNDENKELAISWIENVVRKMGDRKFSKAEEQIAIDFIKNYAANGNVKWQFSLGFMYEKGYGVKRDLKQAEIWYEKARQNGDENATNQLVDLLVLPRKDDVKFKPNYNRAAVLLEGISNKNGTHYYNLGYFYGKLKKLDKMIEAYEKAIDRGNANAMWNLAVCYRNGEGVVKSYSEALSYKYLAQANGEADEDTISFLENHLDAASIRAAQKKAQLLHAKIKKNKNNPQSDSASEAPEGDTPNKSSGSGSGIIISKTGVVATAFHVVEGAAKIKIITSNATYKGEVLAFDKSNDIAILQIEGGDSSFTAVPIASSGAVKLGQSVFTLGFPNIEVQGFNLKMTKGDISSTSGLQDDPRLFQISVPVQSGNSGGPLFDENGNVVGIVVSKLNAAFMAKQTGDLPQNVNYAVKSAYLKPLVEEFSEQLPNRNRSIEEGKTEDLVSKVKDACVMILVD
jgi:TPR repeat protein